MECPKCDGPTNILDSRKHHPFVIRKRRCPTCKLVVKTAEVAVAALDIRDDTWEISLGAAFDVALGHLKR